MMNSAIKNHPLLLAHYSKNHQGFFVEYDFAYKKGINWATKNYCAFLKVNYGPVSQAHEILYPHVDSLHESPKAFEYMISTKPEDWAYEEE